MVEMKARQVGMVFAALVVLVMLFLYLDPEFDLFRRDHMVTSKVDHESYSVQEEFENKQRAADILAEINGMYVRMITHLKRNCINGPWRQQIEYLASNYSPLVLGEHIPTNLKYTSYVSKKGEKIRLCLRTPENRNVFHEMNLIRFVALHELTHMAVKSFGHEQFYWDTFRFILIEAEKIGEIKLVDYSKHPARYCGIIVESSPVF